MCREESASRVRDARSKRAEGPALCQPRAQPWETVIEQNQAPTGRRLQATTDSNSFGPPLQGLDTSGSLYPGLRCATPWADLTPARWAYSRFELDSENSSQHPIEPLAMICEPLFGTHPRKVGRVRFRFFVRGRREGCRLWRSGRKAERLAGIARVAHDVRL